VPHDDGSSERLLRLAGRTDVCAPEGRSAPDRAYKRSWLESDGVYGYRKITDDLREIGESCEVSTEAGAIHSVPWSRESSISEKQLLRRSSGKR